MRAVTAPIPGGPEALVVSDHPTPEPGSGEVRIRVAAAGVNRPDVLQRQGLYPPPAGASPILGLEVSGVIDAVGPGAEPPAWMTPGAAACALLSGGGYADVALAPIGSVLPAPPGLALEHAAGIPEAAFTVWANVFERTR